MKKLSVLSILLMLACMAIAQPDTTTGKAPGLIAPTPPTAPTEPTAPTPPTAPTAPEVDNIDDMNNDFEQAQRDFEEAQRDLEQAQREMEQAQKEMENSKELAEINEAKRDIEESKRDMEEAKRDMEEAKREMEEAKREMREDMRKEFRGKRNDRDDEEKEEGKEDGDNHKSVHVNLNPFGGKNNDYDKCYKNIRTRWLMLDLGVCTLMGDPGANFQGVFDQNYGKSLDWNFHIFKQKFNLYKGKINAMYGLTFEFMHYNFTKNYHFSPDASTFTAIKDTVSYNNNRIYTSWITIPVGLNFESDPCHKARSFRANIGVFGSLMLGSNQKYEPVGSNERTTVSTFNMNQMRFGIQGLIGFGHFNFFANYAITPLFKSGEGPVLNPLNIGVCLLPF